MEQLVTFVLVLVLGGGGLLVALIVKAVSGNASSARIEALERQVSELSDGIQRLRGRVGFLEGEIDKARVAVGRLWTAVEVPRALPPAEEVVADALALEARTAVARVTTPAAAVPVP